MLSESNGFVSIDPRAASIHTPAEISWQFKAIGIFMAKTLMDGQTLGLPIDPLLALLFSSAIPSLDDLALSEPDFHKGLTWVLDNDVTHADLTFTCSYELFGENTIVELIPKGSTTPVTEENKLEYIDLMKKWLFRGRWEPGVTSLLQGFHEHVPSKLLANFRPEELRLLIGGRQDIDVSEMRQNVLYAGGFTPSSPQVEWLWAALEEFDQETLSKFLVFVTGCPSLPCDGLHPPLTLTLSSEGGDIRLPRSHTCFNSIVLPPYSSFAVLLSKLIFALDNATQGFFMT